MSIFLYESQRRVQPCLFSCAVLLCMCVFAGATRTTGAMAAAAVTAGSTRMAAASTHLTTHVGHGADHPHMGRHTTDMGQVVGQVVIGVGGLVMSGTAGGMAGARRRTTLTTTTTVVVTPRSTGLRIAAGQQGVMSIGGGRAGTAGTAGSRSGVATGTEEAGTGIEIETGIGGRRKRGRGRGEAAGDLLMFLLLVAVEGTGSSSSSINGRRRQQQQQQQVWSALAVLPPLAVPAHMGVAAGVRTPTHMAAVTWGQVWQAAHPRSTSSTSSSGRRCRRRRPLPRPKRARRRTRVPSRSHHPCRPPRMGWTTTPRPRSS